MESVHIPSWLPLARLLLYPHHQVGEWGSTLAKLHQLQVPLAASFVVPVQTFQDIADHNQLAEKLEKLKAKKTEAEAAYHQQVAKIFLNLEFPPDIASDLLKAYHQHVGQGLAEVRLSPDQAFSGSDELILGCIEGDTNTFDSLLQLWAEAYLMTDQVIPAAMVIRRQSQPTSSGIALTKDSETETKTQVVLFSNWGATPPRPNLAEYDHFKVDVRTWNTLFAQVAEKSHHYVCHPEHLVETAVAKKLQHQSSLSDTQVSTLAKLVQQIKLLYLHHCQLDWELVNGQFIITHLKPLEVLHETTGLPHPHSAVLTGTPVVSGITEGVCYLDIPSKAGSLPANAILVLKQFTPQVKPWLTSISALIVERPLPHFAHELVHQAQLPTLALVNGAHRYLKQGQAVIVDASSGHIFPSGSSNVHLSPTTGTTLTKVWVTANNPETATEVLQPAVDGVIFNANQTFAAFGEHPLHLVKSSRRDEVSAQLLKAIETFKPTHTSPLLYQPVNLNSADLSELTYSGSYEQTEPNPYLGYHGSLRLTHSFEVLDAELDVLAEVANRNHQRLGLVIPLARTTAELRTVITHVRQFTKIPPSKIELWWQICTPENLAHLEYYLNPELTGVMISVKDIHSLMYGIDPRNRDVYARYPVNVTFMRDLIASVAKTCTHHQVILQTEDEFTQLSDVAAELRLAGISTKPIHAAKTKQFLLELEHDQLRGI
jgi:phosphoenolpyruvate synthase/pyruvate phosphate dikinase